MISIPRLTLSMVVKWCVCISLTNRTNQNMIKNTCRLDIDIIWYVKCKILAQMIKKICRTVLYKGGKDGHMFTELTNINQLLMSGALGEFKRDQFSGIFMGLKNCLIHFL